MAVETLVRGTIVDVGTGRLVDGCVAIDDGEIVALEERPARRAVEADYVAPGLINAHLHVESSMITIPRYGEAVVGRGVTGIVTDPHEVANVAGEAGVEAMYADATRTPLKVHFTVPSHVPVSELGTAGARLGPDAVERLLDHDSVVALGEVSGAALGSEGMARKRRHAREHGLVVDGHLPSVPEEILQEAARSLDTDHESITAEEARRKLELGFRVFIRQGSTSRNLPALAGLPDSVASRRLSLCTDDRDVHELVDEGGIDAVVRAAIDHGIDPVEAVQMATINTAECYGLDAGRIAPGAPADLVLLDDLETWDVDRVCIDGVWNPTRNGSEPAASALPRDTVSFEPVCPGDLAIEAPDGPDRVPVRAIDATGGIQTDWHDATVPTREGRLVGDTGADVLPLSVVERHGRSGTIGRGFVSGTGMERGAIGTTLSHDAHNCVVAGCSHDAMATVANHLREIGGGIAVADPAAGSELTTLPLPLAGLMSDTPLEETVSTFRSVLAAADRIGFDPDGGITKLSFLALEGIPACRLTDRGLVDVSSLSFVDPVRESAGAGGACDGDS